MTTSPPSNPPAAAQTGTGNNQANNGSGPGAALGATAGPANAGGGQAGGPPAQQPAPPPGNQQPPPVYVPVFHTGQLPAANGDVAKSIDQTTKETQRQQALDLYNFLTGANADLSALNHPGQTFTALVSVPNTHKVKLVYGLGLGTSRIGQTSSIAHKLLALHGEGGPTLGNPSVLVFDANIRTKADILCPSDATVEAAFQNNHNLSTHVIRANNQATSNPATANIMQIAPIPAYLAYDAFDADIDAALLYERLRDCQHTSPMLDHAIAFLRSCLVGMWRQGDPKPFAPDSVFVSMPSNDARQWAGQRFRELFPAIIQPLGQVPLPPQPQGQPPQPPVVVQHGAGGAAAPVFNMDAAALQQFFRMATAQNIGAGGGEEKKDDGEMKVSEGEKARMRVMCGLEADSDAFPKWFKDIFAKHQDDKDKLHIISDAIRCTYMFDDAEVPLYPVLLKTILKRDWAASDMGIRASYVNAAKGLSPFAMIDFTLEDVAAMTEDDHDLTSATQVTTSDLKAARRKLAAQVPKDGHDLLLMLQRYGNLLFALFTSQSPLYKQVYKIIKALKRFSLNSRKNLPQDVMASLLWIVLLQSRRFAMGKMVEGADDECLGEFSNMLNQLWAMSTAGIAHVDLPDELKSEPGQGHKRDAPDDKGQQAGGARSGGAPDPKRPHSIIIQPWAKSLKDVFAKPLKDAGNPGVNRVCIYCGVTKESLVPDFDYTKDCRQHLVFGNCRFGSECRLNHKTANPKQCRAVIEKLDKFIKDPLGLPPISEKI